MSGRPTRARRSCRRSCRSWARQKQKSRTGICGGGADSAQHVCERPQRCPPPWPACRPLRGRALWPGPPPCAMNNKTKTKSSKSKPNLKVPTLYTLLVPRGTVPSRCSSPASTSGASWRAEGGTGAKGTAGAAGSVEQGREGEVASTAGHAKPLETMPDNASTRSCGCAQGPRPWASQQRSRGTPARAAGAQP